MALNDLLSSSFLFSIAIIIILIGGIFAYVSYRMSEQDHKISSMLGLISTMAGELQFFRSKLSKKSEVDLDDENEHEDENENENEEEPEKIILDPNNLIGGHILISVSDDEDDDEDDGSDESDDGSDEEEEQDGSDEDEDEDESDEEESDEEELDFVKSEEGDLEEIIELEQPILNLQDITENNIKSIHLEEPIDLNFANKENESMDELLPSDLKSISITDLEETNKKQDYKKMSINKLREVVVEKKLSMDASKLKKPYWLKLLGDE
jgi:hypothetical protein